ncbi:Imm52 family immunity protein [Microbacterium sp. 13-71-7]|jgi:hypothetical protein|uniref:Imm52 family immunity protein n=1 Tax=Microbacterium sp. 13-71-7 TaxID=1970399 RepID=UPI0025D089B6|nr:Imm52 family immunity protein [Microbacterium sp. 13-71-7]
MRSSYIGAYWGRRSQPLEECASQLHRFLKRLSILDSSLERWFLTGNSRAEASQQIQIDPHDLQALLEKGRSRRDVGGRAIGGLGVHFDMWNGVDDSIGLGGTLGAYPSTNLLSNSIALTLPPPDVIPGLYRPAIARELMLAFIEEWSPDWATWSSFDWVSGLEAIGNRPIAGWKTYVTSTRWRYARDVNVERGVNGGDLILMCDSITDVSINELQRLQKQLR